MNKSKIHYLHCLQYFNVINNRLVTEKDRLDPRFLFSNHNMDNMIIRFYMFISVLLPVNQKRDIPNTKTFPNSCLFFSSTEILNNIINQQWKRKKKEFPLMVMDLACMHQFPFSLLTQTQPDKQSTIVPTTVCGYLVPVRSTISP